MLAFYEQTAGYMCPVGRIFICSGSPCCFCFRLKNGKTHSLYRYHQNPTETIVFGLDEKQGFAKVGVYDAQDLQKKLMEVGEAMTSVVWPAQSGLGLPRAAI